MGKYSKLMQKILVGEADSNIDFVALCHLLSRLGFDQRVKGDHHIFTRGDVAEIINLQPKGSKAKPYQIKQVRNLLVAYGLGNNDVD
ncbi:MAG TPA: type II toxin-antitoxin system HicA family toxin [Gammaproteobacteria bacterium]|nr:type II toxin-antitoxin system HicA family toxin [Gammaproteobacteria bacterium]